MIEKLKELPVEEQIKRLTNPDSLKEILLNTNDYDLELFFEEMEPNYLFVQERFDESFFETVKKVLFDSVDKRDDNFLKYYISNYREFVDIDRDLLRELFNKVLKKNYEEILKEIIQKYEYYDYLSEDIISDNIYELESLLMFVKNCSDPAALYLFLGQVNDQGKQLLVGHEDELKSMLDRVIVNNNLSDESVRKSAQWLFQLIETKYFPSTDLTFTLKVLEKLYGDKKNSVDILNSNEIVTQKIKKYIDNGYYINSGSLVQFKSFEYIKYAVIEGKQPFAINYLDVLVLNEKEKSELDSLLKKAIDNGYIIRSNSPNIVKSFEYVRYAVEVKEQIEVLDYLDESKLSEEEKQKLDNIIYGFIDGSTDYINSFYNINIFRNFKYIKYALEKGMFKALDYLDESKLSEEEKQELDTTIYRFIDKFTYPQCITVCIPEILRRFKYIKYAVEKGQYEELSHLDESKLSEEEKQQLDDLVYLAIDKGYRIHSESPYFIRKFKYINYAFENGEYNAFKFLDISSMNDIENQELDSVIRKAIDNGYEINYFSPDFVKNFKYIKYAVDKGKMYAFKFLDLKSITNEELGQLSKGQLQCLKIYNQLALKSASIANDFFDYFAWNMDKVNSDGILLSKIFERNFVLASELSIIDSEIIKKDLSKEQIHCLNIYLNIESSNLKQKFKNYTIAHPNLSIEQINSIAEIFARISKSNSLEIRKLENEISSSILQLDDPIGKLNQIEDIFLKNNLPTVGKVYKVFEIMHPDFNGFDFSNDKVSPVLKSKSNNGREIIVFADLIKSFMGSNNRSMINYLNSLELGNKLFIEVSEGRLSYEQLSNEQIEVLQEFVSHLNTLYNNTKKGKNDDNKELTGNIIDDIRFLKTLFSVDGKFEYDLPDRIIKMYCHFAGIDTLEQAKQYIKRKVDEADSRGRKYAEGEFTLEEGDFVKGIGGIEYLGNILQNGSNSKEYLGSSADSDATPLDTDLCIVLENGSIDETINNIGNQCYGPVYFILKNRNNRFTITRRSPKENNQDVDTKLDLTRLEAFYTGVIGANHYGIRTGFASSEIDYIVVNSYDDRIGLEIAMNGFYIPVVDRQGKLVFSPDEYDKLRSKMNGLSYYEISSYNISDDLETPEILQMASKIDESEREVSIKRNAINETISKVIQKYGLKLKDHVDGDIQEGYVELIDTGSTGRGTNMPGNGDFDYMMRLDRSIMDNPDLLGKIKQDLLTVFGNGDSGVIGTGDFRLKDVKVEGLDVPVDIDITFVERTDKLAYSTDMCISDRLRNIRKQYPDKYSLVIANILEAKKIFKSAGCYKPDRGDNPQGGLGGVGVENWILQNGGSLKYAAMEFLEASEGKSFEEFRQSYKVHDFGENHLAQKKGIYPHDNFVYNNMSRDGYEKMKECLKQYLMEYGKTDDIEKGKTL